MLVRLLLVLAVAVAVAEEGFQLYRIVVEEASERVWQFCLGELYFFDRFGEPVTLVAAHGSAVRPGDHAFAPDRIFDGFIESDYCAPATTGWFAVRTEAPVALASYRFGSDCGEDTPTGWRFEACPLGTRWDCPAGWKVLDAREGQRWAEGCEGEQRDFPIPSFNQLRLSAKQDTWCFHRLELRDTNTVRSFEASSCK